jgi:hypothetical protein
MSNPAVIFFSEDPAQSLTCRVCIRTARPPSCYPLLGFLSTFATLEDWPQQLIHTHHQLLTPQANTSLLVSSSLLFVLPTLTPLAPRHWSLNDRYWASGRDRRAGSLGTVLAKHDLCKPSLPPITKILWSSLSQVLIRNFGALNHPIVICHLLLYQHVISLFRA